MNIDWAAVFSSEATVIGVLIAWILSVMFGMFVPRRYVRGLEKRLEVANKRGDDQAESLRIVANWASKQTDVGDSLAHTLSTLQKKGGENK